MKIDVTFVISVCAILVMLYCLFLVISLKKRIPGGMIGGKWNFLMTLVILFTIGYMSSPFFSQIPENFLRLIVAFIFFFGAVYVAITVKLIYRIIRELSE